MRSALQMYFEHARTKTSCCLSTSALHSQTSKIHSLVSGIILPLTFSSWKFPCPSLRWHRPWASIQAPALSNLVLVRAAVTVPSWPKICKAPFSVLGFGLKPPDSLYKLLNHMVAGLGTVGLKLNLWHEVKIKRSLSVLHYHIPEASRLCFWLCIQPGEFSIKFQNVVTWNVLVKKKKNSTESGVRLL